MDDDWTAVEVDELRTVRSDIVLLRSELELDPAATEAGSPAAIVSSTAFSGDLAEMMDLAGLSLDDIAQVPDFATCPAAPAQINPPRAL